MTLNLTNDEITGLSYRELQEECKKAGLSASGKTKALQQRLRSARTKKPEPTAKRQKRSASDDLTCPITLELPFDPVMAEDGRVYERKAIERYFNTGTKRNHRKVLSPITKEKIGKNLISAPQIRNHIETLVEDGIITGDLADKWQAKIAEKKHTEELLKKARDGDMDAMVDVAQNYDFGAEGFVKDNKKAYEWYEKARAAGSVIGAACIGETLLKTTQGGDATAIATKRMQGLLYLTSAAERGSDFAAYWLGMALSNGQYGLPVNLAESKKWLERAASDECTVIHLLDEDKEKIPCELERLVERQCPQAS